MPRKASGFAPTDPKSLCQDTVGSNSSGFRVAWGGWKKPLLEANKPLQKQKKNYWKPVFDRTKLIYSQLHKPQKKTSAQRHSPGSCRQVMSRNFALHFEAVVFPGIVRSATRAPEISWTMSCTGGRKTPVAATSSRRVSSRRWRALWKMIYKWWGST